MCTDNIKHFPPEVMAAVGIEALTADDLLSPPDIPEVAALRAALSGDEIVATTGVVVQELLHGFVSASAQAAIKEIFGALEYLAPTSDDHVEAAGIRTHLRSSGVQIGAIDALIAQLAIAGSHALLTTDKDFHLAARHVGLQVWQAPPGGSPVGG